MSLLIVLLCLVITLTILLIPNIAEKNRPRHNFVTKIADVIHFALFFFALFVFAENLFVLTRDYYFNMVTNLNLRLSVILPSLAAAILWLPNVQKLVARYLPHFNPKSYLHRFMLPLTMLIPMYLMMMLSVGLTNMAKNVQIKDATTTMYGFWVQDFLFISLAFLGVGFLTRRNFSETLARLGTGKLTWRQFFIAFGVGILSIMGLLVLLKIKFYLGYDNNQGVQELTDKILKPLFNTWPGILTLSVGAALGEELIFRGAIQPVAGLWLTALMFALIHTHYGLTFSTLAVFLFGLVLGFVRQRFNTTASIVTHATYNMVIILLSNLH